MVKLAMIMTFFSLFILFGFGILTSSHSSIHSHENCFATKFNGVNCPSENNLSDFLDFHLMIFKNHSASIFNLSNILINFLVSFSLIFSSKINFVLPKFPLFSSSLTGLVFESKINSYKNNLINWLAIHQKLKLNQRD